MAATLDPRVVRFQQIKARRKAQKIAEVGAVKNIKAANPNLTDKQALQIHQAQQAIKAHTRRIQVGGHQVVVQKV